MSFLSPWALLWAMVGVPILLLYFLKLRRRRVPVSSTWLWTRSIQDLRVNAPFQRLRKSLLLLLQLLLVFLAAAALSEPIGMTSPPEEKRWVFLIDRSASMQMKDVSPSRLGRAKEAAREILSSAGPRDEVMVVAFSNRAQVMTPLTSSRQAIAEAIDRIEPADTSTRLQEAFRIAQSAVQAFKNREIVVLSDGRCEPVQDLSEGVPVRYIPIGGSPRNAAITAIEVRRPARTDEPWTIYAQVDLFHSQELEVPVELYVNSQLKGLKRLKIPPNGSVAAVFEVTRPEPDIVEVKLAMDDDLAADNRAWAVVRHDRAKLLLLSPGNFFLDKALSNVKDLEAFRAESAEKTSFGDYEIVVLDGVMPETLPEGKYLIFGALPPWEGIKKTGEIQEPSIVDWDRRHPVAAHRLNLTGLFAKSAPKLELSTFATPLADSAQGPVIFAWERGRTRALVVTFNLLQSDWPFRMSFPLFLSNALSWLRDEHHAQPRPGEPLRIRLSQNETEVEVTSPRGARERLSGEPGRDVVFGDTDSAGLYTITRKGGSHPIALNLLDPQESSGRVAPELKISTGNVAASSRPPAPVRAYWRWLALLVLAVLLVEWTVYHRRIEF
jgi:hypothetical protein